ncbi:hypothetical protein GDO81_001617 [Engystomops pustulosus]|uniref:Amidohydrolase-related domain-containing protein n=2 Tax=Engystomops pustulosus TaxID=76066 RepID=A0AAV7DF06_ENGPU|nr:hypothetical protein GDO81_001617 [Engystomops pustulosus]KAG8595759.1 hypothetical protein GDO81_001617 [Engystomops pustulosus]
MDAVQQVFKGTFIHSTARCACEVKENHILGTGKDGKILFFEDAHTQSRLAQKWGFDESNIQALGKNEFFMPGMIDTHIHAPQYTFIGTGMERPLLEWLAHTTFPIEDTFSDIENARNKYSAVVRRTLRNGTTTACYFATIHTDASIVLADTANQYGQRAFIGKICMDHNDTYQKYKETTEESIRETKRFVEVLKKKKYDRVKPIITPRFAISCSERLLNELGKLADENDLHIQTVMAHGCYLTNEELDIFRERGAAVSHCPNSNISLCSGHLDVRNVLNHRVKVGLGTDVAGGYSISLLDAIRKSIETSKILFMERSKNDWDTNDIESFQKGNMTPNGINRGAENIPITPEKNPNVLSYKDAFRLATLGGSEALSIDHMTGNFEVGKEFDALLINPDAKDSHFEVFSHIPKEKQSKSKIIDQTIKNFLFIGREQHKIELKDIYYQVY